MAKKCEECAIRDELISSQRELIQSLLKVVESMTVQPVTLPSDNTPQGWWQPQQLPRLDLTIDPMAHCPCRPENGGSGICNCILGGPRITC